MIIVIDGPAGTGKTTVAKEVAKRLKKEYFDTGAMYRSVTYVVLKQKINPDDDQAVKAILNAFSYEIKEGRYIVNQEDVTEKIRSSEVTDAVSKVSAISCVREKLVALQRQFAKNRDVVFEGRDMGTVVFPNAECKIFLTASNEVAAHRRYLERRIQNSSVTKEEVFNAIQQRNAKDSERTLSPLKKADDAHLIDTSELSIEQVVEEVLKQIP